MDGAVDLLKRHSGIVWHPGRFTESLRGSDARRSGNPTSPPRLRCGGAVDLLKRLVNQLKSSFQAKKNCLLSSRVTPSSVRKFGAYADADGLVLA